MLRARVSSYLRSIQSSQMMLSHHDQLFLLPHHKIIMRREFILRWFEIGLAIRVIRFKRAWTNTSV
ncbi:hypothetical protein HI914_01016 [Erysiphe necator]|nr:hypothetical protein HI914_01016 [Erysiphe necator]